MSALQKFLKLSGSKPEIFPLFGIMGIALGGAGFMAVHQARAPDVVWDHKTNASPWQDVKEGEQVKLYALNQKYTGRYERPRF